MARKKAKRKQCRKSNLIYFVMKCTKPVLCALVMKEVCGTQTKNQENILKNYLQQHRHQIAKQLKDIDYEDAYMNILFPPNNSLTNLEKWDLTLLRFVLEKIVKIGETISYYLTRLFDVVTELRRPNSKNCTRVMYAKNRQVLMQMRSKCYKKLKDHRFKDKVERDARKIDSRNQPILKGDTVLEKWIHTEEQTIKEVLKYGQQRYDCIKQLLLKTSGDVLRTLVLEMVKRKGNRSLDDFLHKDMQRILRRLNGKSNEQMDILFPRNNKKTEISKWDVSLLCFILADVCNLDSKSWRSITAIRRTRNELFHRSDCKLSEKCYHSSRKTIEKSLNHCLTVINDKSLTETVKKQMGRIYHCPVEDKEMKELLHKVDLHERDVLAILQRKQEVFDDICSNLKDILKCLGKEQGSELEVELVIRNCPEDQESAISDIIVTAFNEKINDALNGVTCLDETEHRDLKEAVSEIVEMLESKGVTVLRAVKGSVLLKLHCKSFTKACELYDSYKVERCAAEVLNLQIFIRKHIGFDVTLTMAIYENSMLQCIKKTVSSVKKSVRQMEFAPVRSSEPGKNCLPSVKLKLKRRCEYTQCTPDLTAGILEQLEAMSSTLRSQFDIDIFSVCTAQQPLEKMQTVLECVRFPETVERV